MLPNISLIRNRRTIRVKAKAFQFVQTSSMQFLCIYMYLRAPLNSFPANSTSHAEHSNHSDAIVPIDTYPGNSGRSSAALIPSFHVRCVGYAGRKCSISRFRAARPLQVSSCTLLVLTDRIAANQCSDPSGGEDGASKAMLLFFARLRHPHLA